MGPAPLHAVTLSCDVAIIGGGITFAGNLSRARGGHPCRESLTGLDHGQVTCWNSWMRWSLISLIAAALLAVALARTRSAHAPPATDLIPLTRPELLALLRAAVLRAPRRDLAHALRWSCWRRHHQHRAATCHRRWNEITAAATI
jgi:hypothetical protein